MLGLDNPVHILFLLVILLLLFGAKRLPEMGRGLGAGMRDFKDALTGVSHSDEHTDSAPAQLAAHEVPSPQTIVESAVSEQELTPAK